MAAEAALVSDARRAHETWLHLALGAGWDVEPVLSPALYAAGPDAALDLLRETDAGTGTLVVVGHNPTMAYVAELLDDGDGGGAAEVSLGSFHCTTIVTRPVVVLTVTLGG